MTRLTRPKEPRIDVHFTVAKIRAGLRKRGYTASDADIEWAWRKRCRQEYNMSWMTPNDFNIAEFVTNVTDFLDLPPAAKDQP